ncbi:hypothetical protein [Microbulbifer yueqingensis]|uniref:hypothetical protein n=1 Tax=Microbulbifer yueqingensis TaxID=658219 RepID=UPI0011133257|nr:hypothetical protein [Microbulbifer yueqingensis]
MHVLRWSLRSHFRAKSAQGKLPLLAALKLIMKKCCGKTLIPKIRYKASIMDSVGLVILLGFFLSIFGLIAWGLSALLVSIVADGAGSYTRDLVRTAAGILVILYGLYKFLPKLINAFSYLVNYKMTITAKCKSCGKEYVLANYPKSEDPF